MNLISFIKCAFYNSLREELYTKFQNYCKNFIKLEDKSKFVWLMTTEDIFLVENFGHFLIQKRFLMDEVLHDRLILYNV